MIQLTKKLFAAAIAVNLFALLLWAILGFTFKPVVKNHLVQIEQIDNLEVFICSSPLDSFIVLGEIKAAPILLSTKPYAVLKHMVKRARNSYKEATGLILNISNDLGTATVIKSIK